MLLDPYISQWHSDLILSTDFRLAKGKVLLIMLYLKTVYFIIIDSLFRILVIEYCSCNYRYLPTQRMLA